MEDSRGGATVGRVGRVGGEAATSGLGAEGTVTFWPPGARQGPRAAGGWVGDRRAAETTLQDL